jgi:hypothetical protein
METDPQTIDVGDLMTRADLLSREDLQEAREIAKGGKLQIGRVLVMSAFVTEPQLALAQAVLDKFKNGTITLDEAIQTLRAAQCK